MKHLLFILLILGITSCSFDNSYDYKINRLPHKELSYDELPKEVNDYLSLITQCDTDIYYLAFVNPADSSRFRIKVVESLFVSTWIAYYKLLDTDKNITYRIERGVPSPYIIYDNKLYIPNEFMVLSIGDVDQIKYKEYELK